MSQSAGRDVPESGNETESARARRAAHASEALRLSGVELSDADLALALAEFERAIEIVKPLLDVGLPDGLDQAGVYRP